MNDLEQWFLLTYVLLAIINFFFFITAPTFGETTAKAIFWPIWFIKSLIRGFFKVWKET